ncbi:F-box and WD repeat domain containing protein 10B isoform X1 [Hemiscyllium ocellatum]|uniref:F-box and WD repeat domain containing protein 10B isoform X1 n=1 Tax=Hemiscyllium ocellatum TaxID=170820 RepID=UPI002966FB18|nr:F-box and WD repeat domain containing protein 10B isoform X1 [Hemiscyllium ocellatum]
MHDLDAAGEMAVFNLYTPSTLTCRTDCSAPHCGSCYTCTLQRKLASTKQWFLRAGDITKQEFLIGLVRRVDSLDLLLQLDRVLQPTLSKDFTHSRSSANPSLPEDFSTLSSDRSLNKLDLHNYVTSAWEWFTGSKHWTKTNYLLGLFQLCDVKHLHHIGNLIRILIIGRSTPELFEWKGEEKDEDDNLLHESNYTFRTDEHPELKQLTEIWPEYSEVTLDMLPSSLLYRPEDKTVAASRLSLQLKSKKTKKKQMVSMGIVNESPVIVEPVIPIRITSPFEATSGVTYHKDFIRCLPIHLAKYILGFLDQNSLQNCMLVSRYWAYLGKEFTRDTLAIQCIFDEIKKLQATAPHNINTVYAKICQIPVPRIDEKGFTIPTQNLKKKIGLAASYIGIHTDMVQMEERNVYCGPYNIIVIKQLTDVARVIHYDGGQWIAMASGDRRIRFLDINHSKEVPHSLSGHAGAIKAVILCEEQGFLLSGSYDLTIRKWNLKTAMCVTMYRGHTGFITCLSLHENMLVSGSTDCHAKVWDLQKGTCFHTFKQDKSILSVGINATYVVSGNEKGVIHVWNIKPPSLVKVLTGHINSITCMSFDQWHLISGSKDKCIKVWSMMGKFSDCLMTFKHPQEVLCLQFVYLRVISGCRDGKIRIFDLLNGICLRMMRATGHGDPVLSIHIAGNRMVINTMSNVVKFQFEDIVWDYKAKASILDAATSQDKFKMAPLRKQPYSYVRAQRMRRIGSTNEKIYHRQEKFSKDGLFHHARFLSARCMKAAQRIQSDSMKALSLRESQYRDHSASYSLQSEFDLKPPSAYMSSSEMLTQKHLKQDADSRILYGERSKSLSAASRFLSVSEQGALKHIKRHKFYKPKTVDQIYLTVNAIHNYLRFDETSINTLYNNSLSEDWGQPLCPFEDTVKKGSDTAKKKATVKMSDTVDAVGLRDDCIDVKTLMAPFELKMQKFKEKDKFSGLDTKCFVTKPMIKRSKSAVAFVDSVKFRRAKGRPQSAVEEINKSMSSRTTRSNNGSRAKAFVLIDSATATIEPKHKLQHIVDINPYRNNSGFTLSTVTQQKEYAEKIARDHNGQQQRTSNTHS